MQQVLQLHAASVTVACSRSKCYNYTQLKQVLQLQSRARAALLLQNSHTSRDLPLLPPPVPLNERLRCCGGGVDDGRKVGGAWQDKV